jgi:peptide/nickel transport system permease protein
MSVAPAESIAPDPSRRATPARVLKRPSVIVGITILGLLVICTVGAGVLAPHDPLAVDSAHQLQAPAWSHGGSSTYLLGTDQLGRDVLSRLMYGARTSLVVAASAAALAALFGLFVGLITGYFRGATDAVLMRLADVQLAFPFIVLALAILSVSDDRTKWRVILVLAIADWVVQARVVRGRVLAESQREYVRAARAVGASHARTIVRYILPNVVQTVVVIALLEFGVLMLVESILSFVGLGVSPPAISWGTIMADGRENIAVAWWLLAFPGLAIFLAVLGLNLIADGLADVLDPRLALSRRMPRHSGAARTDAHGGGRSRRRDADVPRRAQGGEPALEVTGLAVEFPGQDAPPMVAVGGIDFTVNRGECVGLVGESGSGKSITALALIGLVPPPGRVTDGSVRLNGVDVLDLSPAGKRAIRGSHISMIFQDASTALNPSLRVGYQIVEAIRLHQGVRGAEARRRALESLTLVQIPDPERVFGAYAFELSGGMQQRIMIAIAISCRPAILIADEPTTALDVTTQAQILNQLTTLTEEIDTGVLLITHDLAVVAQQTDRVIVMYKGAVVESGPTLRVVNDPQHPYTRQLLAAVEAVDVDRAEVRVS